MKNLDKPFVCDYCPKRFRIEVWKNKHMDEKHPEERREANGRSESAPRYEVDTMREIFSRFDNLSSDAQAFVLTKLNERG